MDDPRIPESSDNDSDRFLYNEGDIEILPADSTEPADEKELLEEPETPEEEIEEDLKRFGLE